MDKVAPIFCTVIEPGKNWVNAAALLVQSLRSNGGTYSESLFIVFVAGISNGPKPIFKDDDRHLFVFGTNRDPVLPHLNKLSALRLVDFLPFTHLILLDHDTIVLRLDDLGNFLTDAIHARRNYKYGLTHMVGKDYVKALSVPGLPPWARIHYFNSGVVFVPQRYCHSLEVHWRSWTENLIHSLKMKSVTEQIAFAMTLASEKLPYKFLPIVYNQIDWGTLSPDAAIIHYNAFDRINRDIKNTVLYSFEDLRAFLNDTDNRFWRLYASDLSRLLTPELGDLANAIYRIVESA